jgi:AraC-like DNA-binding protein
VTVPAQRPPSAVLDHALDRLRLEGALLLRAEHREPWAEEAVPGTAAGLRAEADRVMLLHVVVGGTCWVSVEGAERHWAVQGDVVVLPYGDPHRTGGTQQAELVSLSTLRSRDPLFDPALRVFPPVFVVRPAPGPAAEWVRASVAYALQQCETSGGGGVRSRLPELLLAEVLRLHLASAPAADEGWLAALEDPVLQPALALLHGAPGRRWSVTALAREATVSRSVLDARFRDVLGRSPIRYLTDWRMHLAEDLLATTDLSVSKVAHQVGYDAEEAFSRAFKRAHGSAPGAWRSAHPMR